MLKVGTDCSGIEAPIQALKQLKIPFKHVFSSEIDKYCIQSIKANYNPEIIFGDKDGPFPEGDITKRDIKDVPDIDLYVCGFPCQPFSQAGNRKGFEDTRGNVFFSCLDVIKKKKPKVFILENVKGILSHDKKRTFKRILEEVNKLEDYNIYWKVLNTKDYGIPQNRERVFIVGIKVKYDKGFQWPEYIQMKNINSYIDKNDKNIRKIADCVTKTKMLSKIPTKAVFIDLAFHKHTYPNSHIYCPSISANSRLWCVPMSRYTNSKEKLMLQGFPTKFKKVVSNTQLNKQIGNSMTVNVLKCLLKNILKYISPVQAILDMNIGLL
jgi:DNA (cytosine-5)-methyltransferase 1